MKRIVLVISSFFIIGIAVAQSNYIVHTIKDGETLTKLANKYGTTVGDIMRLNQMTTSSKLSIGEEVKIPTSQSAKETTHVVAKGETLYSIAKRNHITVVQLRDWNNIPDNTIKDGQTLRLTAPDNNSATDIASNAASSSQEKNTSSADNSVSANTVAAAQNSADDNAKQRSSDADTETSQTSVNNNPDEGVFGVTYQSKANGTELITKGTASIFKSASGWEDKKYYILMNDIAPGTIVKVQANGKTVYAKVLWNLGNVKENQGLSYRISDAAAGVLNLSGNTFDIIVSYYK